jgi:hypothetical protein
VGAEQTPSSEHVSLPAVTLLLERRERNSVSDKDVVKNFMVSETEYEQRAAYKSTYITVYIYCSRKFKKIQN